MRYRLMLDGQPAAPVRDTEAECELDAMDLGHGWPVGSRVELGDCVEVVEVPEKESVDA